MKLWLGVDVDGVVVDTVTMYKKEAHNYKDSLDFWRVDNLYDNLKPIEGAVEKLHKISEHIDIVFVSRLKGQHHRSKVYFLKEFFPFLAGFVGTHEKYLLQNSMLAMIDDLEDNLKLFEQVKRVHYGSEWFKDWNSLDVDKFINWIKEKQNE